MNLLLGCKNSNQLNIVDQVQHSQPNKQAQESIEVICRHPYELLEKTKFPIFRKNN